MSEKEKIVIYTPTSDFRNPFKLMKSLWEDIFIGHELAWRLLRRNIIVRYRQSFLGILWAFLPPIVATFMWVFLQETEIINFGKTAIPYPVYVMVGTILWGVFSQSINVPINVIKSSKAMITKINFPKITLLMVAFGEIVFDFLIKIIILVFLLFWFGIIPGWTLILFFVGVLLIIFLGMTIGIWLTPFALLSGDIQAMLSAGIGIWFFLTPVIYPVPKVGIVSLLADYNPISPLLIVTRDWLTIGEVVVPMSFWIVSFSVLFLFILGLFFYKVSLPHVIERVGN